MEALNPGPPDYSTGAHKPLGHAAATNLKKASLALFQGFTWYLCLKSKHPRGKVYLGATLWGTIGINMPMLNYSMFVLK